MTHRIAIPYRQNTGMMTPMPLLDLVLSYHEHTIHTTALIDSGAMISILPFEYGEQLGLSWEEQHVNVQLGRDTPQCASLCRDTPCTYCPSDSCEIGVRVVWKD